MALFSFRSDRRQPEAALRNVRDGDGDRIRRILQTAFEDENERMGMRTTRLPVMTDRLLGHYLSRAPQVSFVAEARGGPIGFCLACRWGDVAWLGPIAVLPPVQGRGVGRRLVEASVAALRDRGVKTLGLETMPRSYRNLQFYTELGMAVSGMTWDVSRYYGNDEGGPEPVLGPGAGVGLRSVAESSGGERGRLLEEVTRLSKRVSGALDYAGEVERTLDHRLGDAFVAYTGEVPCGFALVHTEPYAREEEPGTGRVNVAVALPLEGEETPGRALIAALERELIGEDIEALIFRVPSAETSMVRWLTGSGFRISHSDARMCFEDLPEERRPDVLHLNKWE
ncbi:MAG: GNAT family N-acetyltransferase [bacterium]